MGSLPNLHQLSAGDADVEWQNELLGRVAAAFKNREAAAAAHRGHKAVAYTRSLGSDPNACIADAPPSSGKSARAAKWPPNEANRRSRSVRSSSVIPACHSAAGGGGSGGGAPLRHQMSRQASVTSSTGTSSVRKLIAVVRSTPSHLGPVYSRPLICQNFVALCLSHGMLTVAFVPIIVLEGSISAWSSSSSSTSFPATAAAAAALEEYAATATTTTASLLAAQPRHRRPLVSSNVGSLLVALLYVAAAGAAPLAAYVNHKLSVTRSLWLGHLAAVLFVGAHLYPKLYVLAPAYALMGLSIGHLDNAKTSYAIMLASKLKLVPSEEEEYEFQSKLDSTRRESLVHKLYRGLSFAQNLGLVVGGILTYALIRLTAAVDSDGDDDANGLASDGRVCGYDSCPRDASLLVDAYANRTWLAGMRSSSGGGGGGGGVQPIGPVLPCKTTAILAGVFLGCCAVGALVNALFVHRLRICYNRGPVYKSKFENASRALLDTFKDSKLRLVTPLLVFIGIEQGFMYADFTKLYVICAMGVENAPLIFISLGMLQFVAGVTCSLLIHHVRKYLIVGVGVVFQACLLLVLIVWKPTSDDAALFYVISAAWGVCNAIWDTLTFCLLVSRFPDCWEFAFSHNFLWRYLGLCLAFSYHGLLCTSVKLYVMCAMLPVAVLPYAWLEIKLDSVRSARNTLVYGWRR
ncbi:hypothetical protein V9T40_013173 [Parthenolecanium corni]|uniref:UNC93-like protein n=1 Tax=Parthenolecanium corni TaxID=536013 RepID=A0AAN9Y4X6_9HEMI